MFGNLITRLLSIDRVLVDMVQELAKIRELVRKCHACMYHENMPPPDEPCWNIAHAACVIVACKNLSGKTRVYESIEAFQDNRSIKLRDYVKLRGRRKTLLRRLKSLSCPDDRIKCVNLMYDNVYNHKNLI